MSADRAAGITEAEAGDDGAVVAFPVRLLTTIAKDPLLRPSYRTAAHKHLARLRAGAGRQLTAGDFRTLDTGEGAATCRTAGAADRRQDVAQ